MLSTSNELEQLVENTQTQFPAICNPENADDLDWSMFYSKENGCVVYSFGSGSSSDEAFDYVLAQAKELNLVIYNPQGHAAFFGLEETPLP